MPSLQTCCFNDGDLDLLRFKNVPNLKHISSTLKGGCPTVKKVIFCDLVPFFDSFHLPHNEQLTLIDGNVNWKNMKNLALVYSNTWEKIWLQLESIEILSIDDIFPDVWPNLKNLHSLSLTQMHSIRLQNVLFARSSLTFLDLHWDYHSSFDIADLLWFPNISTLNLHGSGNYQHLDSLVSMPHLQNLEMSMNITKSEEIMLREWNESVPTRSLKAYFLNKTNSF
jgi:hypothetical protein